MLPVIFLGLFFCAFLLLAKLIRAHANAELNKHRKTRVRCGLSGAEIARRILDAGGAQSVQVIDAGPEESNRYLPRTKQLELDRNIHRSRSLTAMALASRAATQALQQLEKYPPYLWRREVLRLNRAAVLIAIIAFAAVFAARIGNTQLLAAGVVLGWIGLLVLNLSSLAVEWKANQRAIKMLAVERLIELDEPERQQLGLLLRSAAWHETAAILDAFKSPFAPLIRIFRGST